jgi:2-oxoglutarate dehydrogenase E1 component
MDSYSYIANADVATIDNMYEQYKADPQSVDASWHFFFKGFEFSNQWSQKGQAANGQQKSGTVADRTHVLKEVEVVHFIRGIRARGHMMATIDPLYSIRKHDPNLNAIDFKLSDDDLDTYFEAGTEVFGRAATLREIDTRLKKVYTGNIGFEYQYIRDRKIKGWFRKKLEQEYLNTSPTVDEKKRILQKLVEAAGFENFLQTKFVGKKRFSLEGGESIIAGLDVAMTIGADMGVEEIYFGMAHRGRLNVLTNIMQKPYEQVFMEFNEDVPTDEFTDGDVKYHMGYSGQVKTANGKELSVKLLPNPSHLDAVDPVVLGYTRSRADAHFVSNGLKPNAHNSIYDKVLPILIHGDASLAGQGIIYEITQMSNLPGYYVGGTLHVIINNQVGFTTSNGDARSSMYCSDVAKSLDTPIFHVNGNDPEAVLYAMKLAIEFRQEFNRDVFVDIICYRKHGHNEADEPRFTQPLMYQIIAAMDNPRELYIKKLIKDGVIDEAHADNLKKEFAQKLQKLLEAVKNPDSTENGFQLPKYVRHKLERDWSKLRRSTPKDFDQSPATGITKKDIKSIGKVLSNVPEDFTPIKQIVKVLEERTDIFAGKKPVNWATAELLAYGSLLKDGKWVRLSGQDVERGTFSHRHAVLHDIKNNAEYINLEQIKEEKGKFEIYNSLLSEYGVLGFEYGYALANPNALVIWEAQFGDFANGAQIMIDQFIAASESKWEMMNGLVLLLPHGYEGQGPEHSNARPERFLQLAAENNMYVCNCTTPANFFHMLRRQLTLPFRKPCIHMSPKSMLRNPQAVSELSAFVTGTSFQEVIEDTYADAKKVKRILLCSGKIYWDLQTRQEEGKRTDIAVVRVEQLHPFPKEKVENVISKYSGAETIWVQEEPENMGAWSFILREFPEIGISDKVARKKSASPATGYSKIHTKEQKSLIDKAFN